MEDPCAVKKIQNYRPDVLEPYTKLVYSFEEKNQTKFVIQYDRKKQTATVQSIEYWKQSKKQIAKHHDIEGNWDNNTVEIDTVILGTARGEGLCTHAVGYMLKVLLIEAEKVNQFPTYGTVFISSKNFCAAVNCYSHAFMMNGFTPNIKELEAFHEKTKDLQEGEDAEFTFSNFYSQSQKEKKKNYQMQMMRKKRKRGKTKPVSRRTRRKQETENQERDGRGGKGLVRFMARLRF